VLTLFIGLMAACALALGWLGWQVLVQDRVVEAQRRQEQLEGAADRVLAATERALANPTVEVTVKPNREAEIIPAGRLAYVPSESAPEPPVPAGVFDEAEALEFGRQDGTKAAQAYVRLAESGSAQVRAEALVRLARVQRRDGKYADALRAYASLEKLGSTLVAGMPASLVACSARCSALKESGDAAGAQREASALWVELTGAKWKLTRETLETYLNALKALAPEVVLPKDWDERMALSGAASWAFGQERASGVSGTLVDGQVVSVSWERQNGNWSARLVAPSSWQALWSKLERDAGIRLRVVDPEGHVLHGSVVPPGAAAFRPASLTGLPWNITTTAAAAGGRSQSSTARRRLLIAGLAIFALVLVLGSLLIARAISHELAVARLQSDFVSAVSHEFRTPLTAIRQLMEMLDAGRMESEQHKRRAYQLVLAESDRLRRLVESLLDFGRMQAREYRFRTDGLEAAQWTRSVAADFQETVRSKGYVIEFSGPSNDVPICGDREALGGALWNLLDNAVKYSPEEKQVQVAVSASNGMVEVSVRDRGSGIAKEDLKRVFAKFYRGANAKQQGTKGTGIGLAMVKEIVEAHGGAVRVRSEPGQGSEFTMVLPCRES
jgi:signal transduction histidine kinase